MDTLRRDLLYALRALRAQPGFALVTMLTLALGIGANTAIFSVVNGVLLRPLGYPDPARLMFITSQFPGLGFDQFWVSVPEYADLRDHQKAFDSLGGYTVGAVNLGAETPTRPVRAQVTPDLLPTLGVQPAAGRWFTAADSVPGAAPVTILSWEIWQRTFAGDGTIVGRPIQLNNVSTEVVGIMPRGFDVHDQRVEVWSPLAINPQNFPNQRGGHFLYLIARLKQDVSPAKAGADIERLLTQWRTIIPAGHVPSPTGHRIRMDPLKDDIVGPVQTALLVLQAAVVFVLLIACANLANLLLARAESRQREFAVRSAMGASRGRLLRQFVTEGLLLAVIAATIGVGLAWLGLSSLLAVSPDAIPRATEIGLDWPVLAFTLALAIATGAVFGMAPLLHLSRRLNISLRDAGRGATAGTLRKTLRGALVISEVTLAVILVVGASLLVRSFVNLMKVDPGFDRAHLTTFGVVLPGTTYDAAQRVSFFARLEERLRGMPGVAGVASMTGLPPDRPVNANDTDCEHIAPPPPGTPPGAAPTGPAENVDYWQQVTRGYIETMGIPVLQGRGFQPGDVGGPPVVLVNEALVRRFFADRDPIGRRLKPGFGDTVPWFTIVGVVKDVKQAGIDDETGTEIYLLADQLVAANRGAPSAMNVVLRSTLPMSALAEPIRQAVRELDPRLPIVRMRTMDEVFGESVARPRFLTLLLGIFAGLALLLAAVGTYGILSYLVAQRQQEIGIRMALGAPRGTVLRLILRHGLILAGIGLVLGLSGAIAVGRFLQSMLFGITPTDPFTLALVAGLMIVVSVLACLIPALRATRVDPLVVLRET